MQDVIDIVTNTQSFTALCKSATGIKAPEFFDELIVEIDSDSLIGESIKVNDLGGKIEGFLLALDRRMLLLLIENGQPLIILG